jgi:hypothetical protein
MTSEENVMGEYFGIDYRNMLTEASMSQIRFGTATTNKDYLEIEITFLERHGEDHFGWNRWVSRRGTEAKPLVEDMACDTLKRIRQLIGLKRLQMKWLKSVREKIRARKKRINEL